jgi:hypothetical protein
MAFRVGVALSVVAALPKPPSDGTQSAMVTLRNHIIEQT